MKITYKWLKESNIVNAFSDIQTSVDMNGLIDLYFKDAINRLIDVEEYDNANRLLSYALCKENLVKYALHAARYALDNVQNDYKRISNDAITVASFYGNKSFKIHSVKYYVNLIEPIVKDYYKNNNIPNDHQFVTSIESVYRAISCSEACFYSNEEKCGGAFASADAYCAVGCSAHSFAGVSENYEYESNLRYTQVYPKLVTYGSNLIS